MLRLIDVEACRRQTHRPYYLAQQSLQFSRSDHPLRIASTMLGHGGER